MPVTSTPLRLTRQLVMLHVMEYKLTQREVQAADDTAEYTWAQGADSRSTSLIFMAY